MSLGKGDWDDVKELLHENGFVPTRQNVHHVWKNPAGLTWTTPTSSSDSRAAKNNLADLKMYLKTGKVSGIFGNASALSEEESAEADRVLKSSNLVKQLAAVPTLSIGHFVKGIHKHLQLLEDFPERHERFIDRFTASNGSNAQQIIRDLTTLFWLEGKAESERIPLINEKSVEERETCLSMFRSIGGLVVPYAEGLLATYQEPGVDLDEEVHGRIRWHINYNENPNHPLLGFVLAVRSYIETNLLESIERLELDEEQLRERLGMQSDEYKQALLALGPGPAKNLRTILTNSAQEELLDRSPDLVREKAQYWTGFALDIVEDFGLGVKDRGF